MRRLQWRSEAVHCKMIILLTLLYAFLSSGGYLDGFSGLGNFTGFSNISGLLGFQNSDSDSTTPSTITLKPIILKYEPRVRNKTNSRRILNMRNFDNGFLSTSSPIRTSEHFIRRRPASRFRVRNKFRRRNRILRKPTTPGTLSSKSTTTKTPMATITNIVPKNNVSSDVFEVIELTNTTDIVPKINATSDVVEVVELDDESFMQMEAAVDTTTDIPLQSTHVTKFVDKCPEEGYLFKKDYQSGSPTVCYLCFCRDNSTAVCWPRDSKRCDAESYQHNWEKKRASRNRRSPLSFGNLFMEDAARDALNSNGKRHCKPHEASYSEGCPPDDWCVGCTVCDCNNNGKWDCHLLSFCSDVDKKKENNKREQLLQYNPFTTPKSRRAEKKLAQESVQKLAEKMAQERQKKKIGKNNSRRYFFRNGTLVNKTIFDLRKRKKSATVVDQGEEVMAKWNDVNMKIRKIPDNIQRQMMLDNQNKNAKKVSESANFHVRKMPNQKTKQNIQKYQAEAVSLLAKREPVRKKKRQIILPSGVKLPKEILKKLPDGIIPPSRDPPGKHFPKASHVKRVLTNQMAATKPPRKELPENVPEVPETEELAVDESKKVLVKRSALKQPYTSKSAKHLRNKKAATRGSKIINSKLVGLKEKTKQKSVQNTNTKITDKRKSSINKNSHLKDGNYRKKNTKEYKNNIKNFKNNQPKRADITKGLTKKHNSKRRSLKNKYQKSNTKNQKSKIIKRKVGGKSGPKNIKDNMKPKFIARQKHNINKKNDTKINVKKPISKLNKLLKTKKNNTKINNTKINSKHPVSKLTKLPKSKNVTETKDKLRNKRSNKDTWSKTIKEGHLVKKIEPKNVSKKSTPKKRSLKANKPQIDTKLLNEQVKKITRDIQANLNRKVLDAVGQMMHKNLSSTPKKVKRSVFSYKEMVNSAEPNLNNMGNTYENEIQTKLTQNDAEKDKLSLSQSLFKKAELRMNESESLKIQEVNYDIYVPTAYHRKRVNISTTKNETIESSTYHASKNVSKKAELRMNETEPLKNQEDNYDIYVPTAYHRKTVNISITTTTVLLPPKNETIASSTIHHASLNANRPKRGANDNLSNIKNLEDVENEMSSNTLQDISHVTTQNKFDTQDSILKYYKYTIDDDNHMKSTNGNYFNEVVEMFTKNAAAKRSVDKQIQSSPDFDVLQLIPNLSNNKSLSEQDTNNTFLNVISSKENGTNTRNEKMKVSSIEISNRKPINVLDDSVVIIEDHNAPSIEHLGKFITPVSTSNTNNAFKSNSVNVTVIGVKQESKPTVKSGNDTHTTKLNKIIEVNYETGVDKTVVRLNDLYSSTSKVPTSAEYNLESKSSTDVNANKMPLLISTTEKIKTSEKYEVLAKIRNPLPDNNTILLASDFPTSLPNVTQYGNEQKIDESIVIIRDNEYYPQATLHYDHSTNVLELTTENYKKSQYRTDKNITKQDTASSENEINDMEVTIVTPKMTTERLNNNITKTTKTVSSDYFTYEFDTKSSNLTKNSNNLKKYDKAKSKQEMVNVIENLKSNYSIKNRFMLNDAKTKAQDNIPIRTNATVLTSDPKINSKIYSSTLMDKVHNFTNLIINNFYTNTMSLTTESIFTSDKTNHTSHKNKFKSNDIKKVNLKKIKKHKLKKILTTLFNRRNKDERQLLENNFELNNSLNKVNDMKTFFKKLISGFKFNKHSRKSSNNKKFQILKYLQKFFKQIFTANGTDINNKTITSKTNRKHVIETLCKTFGPCNINIKNKAKLRSKLDHLNSETYKMLRSVKIIKGLLKLVDITRNDKNMTTKKMFKSDVQKLHEILRDTYSNNEQKGSLTETQKIQIQYIKNNTQYFIQSAAKFTMVLNDIINVITEPDVKRVKNTAEINNENDRKRLLKTRSMNKTVAGMESHESLLQLKELISKYSLIQNTFMRKMYNILTDIGSKESANNEIIKPNSTPIVNSNVQNKTEEIQVYTRNIIENLRKLKNLAQHLNGNVRRKRELRVEDSFEYLLMLMEYLLKQQKPLDSTPVNDGIDLLLEAIKSAPDIKSIQKKVLPIYNNTRIFKHLPYYRARLNQPSKETNRSKETSESDSVSDDKHIKEDNVSSSASDEPKNNIVNNFFDDDADEEDYYAFNRRAQQSSATEASTTSVKELTTRVFEFVTETNDKKASEVKENIKPKTYATSNSNEDFYNRFTEDEVISRTNNAPEFDYTLGSTVETSTNAEIVTTTIVNTPKIHMSRYNKVDEDVSASKSRLDWLDETYEEEIKAAETRRLSTTTEKPTRTTDSYKKTTRTEKKVIPKQAKKSTNINKFSKVMNDLSTKATTREIMYKKELELLNSLDYANVRLDADGSASRESGAIDKYSGDAFSAYMS